jgi:hypothetical protein
MAAPTWRSALASQITKSAVVARKSRPWTDPYSTSISLKASAQRQPRFDDWDSLSWVRLALGAGWAPAVTGEDAKTAGVSGAALCAWGGVVVGVGGLVGATLCLR